MINLLTEQKAWETRQIDKRVVAMIRQRYSLNDEQLLSRILHGAALGTYQMSDQEQAEVQAYQDHAEACRAVGRLAKANNQLLIGVLAYEQAQRDVARLTLLINGRDYVPAVPEVPEERDPETGQVTQEYQPPVPAVEAVEPLPPTVDQHDENGTLQTVDNPEYLAALDALNTAQAVIENVEPEVLTWVEQRSAV
ncbi:hypothetical protein [Marinobacterium sp. MBR-109]|jgi:hypothetical protein|uniref:hypothetical protein n=1 Tax=Marinobacterium sp. MBR-109 TaxID=3156462 RepID=UPI00339A8909